MKNILVIRDGRIGDLLMISPVINWLSEKYPDARLDIMIGKYGSFVFENNKSVTDLILYNRKMSIGEHLNLIRKLRSNKYDVIIILESNSHYKILSYLFGGKLRLGISGKMDWLLHYHSNWDTNNHAIMNNLNVLIPLREEYITPSTDMSLMLSEEDISKAREFLKKNKINSNQKIIFIQPACGPSDNLRPWPQKHIAELSDLLIENLDAAIIFNSGPNEGELINKIRSRMKHTPIINSTEINITAALIELSDVYVGPDTGTTHIANALHKPLIALFGPTSEKDCGPIGAAERVVVIKKEFDCSPCVALRESKERDKCSKQGMADCMLSISVDEVYNSIRRLLKVNAIEFSD